MTAKTDEAPAPQPRLGKPRLALAIATALGVGYIPKAPGTFGSLVGVATAFLSAVFFLRPASLGGLLSLQPNYDAVLMDRHFLVPGSDLHNAILALPIFCALSLVNWKYLLLGFILFRAFDIWKPWPVRQLEKLPGGWGIMADDWMAGIYAAILLRVALHFGL